MVDQHVHRRKNVKFHMRRNVNKGYLKQLVQDVLRLRLNEPIHMTPRYVISSAVHIGFQSWLIQRLLCLGVGSTVSPFLCPEQPF
jgi:hypothetical protein